jgi:hypothetical protein
MSNVYAVMSDCGRAASDSMAAAQKSRQMYNSLLQNRTEPTKVVEEKRRKVTKSKVNQARPTSSEEKLSNLLDSKAKKVLPMTQTYFNNQTPVPIPGQRAGVSCRTGAVPRMVVQRTYPSDALREERRKAANEQLYQANQPEQEDVSNSLIGDIDSLDKLNFQEGWKSETEAFQPVSSGPSFVQVGQYIILIHLSGVTSVLLDYLFILHHSSLIKANNNSRCMNTKQVSVPRTPTSSLYEAPDSSAASLDESSESSFHPVVPQHKTSSPFKADHDHPRRRSPSRVYIYVHSLTTLAH